MGKKGQTSLIFIILIPVFMIIAALAVDTGVAMYYEKKQKDVAEEVITTLLKSDLTEDEYYKRAKYIFEENKIDTEYLSINSLGDKITLYNSDVHYSFLGTLFKNISHQSVVEAEGYKDSNGNIVVTFPKDDKNDNQ